jgi:type VI protein secretion system component Hcp
MRDTARWLTWVAALAFCVGCSVSDDDNDAAGPAGPAGPPGAAGAAGAPGPAGANAESACVEEEVAPASGSGLRSFALLSGIQGESIVAKHANEIDLVSVRAAIGRGACASDRFVIVKNLDRATPLLLSRMASSTPIDSAVISVDSTGDGVTRVTWTLTKARVERIRTAWVNGVPAEELTLGFERVVLQYYRQTQTGAIVAEPPVCWDAVTKALCAG